MSSERYDERYVEIDGIKVLTYLVPDYNYEPDHLGEYFDRNPRGEYLERGLVIDRVNRWVQGVEIDPPPVYYERGEFQESAGLTWTFLDDYYEGALWYRDVPEGIRRFYWYRGDGAVVPVADTFGKDVIDLDPPTISKVSGTTIMTFVVMIDAPANMPDDELKQRIVMLTADVNVIADEYDRTHTEEGRRIYASDLPRRSHQYDYRYYTSQDYGDVSLADKVRYMIEDYERAEGLNRGAWWYLGVVAEWPDADDSIYHDSLWGVESDADEYIEELRRELAQNVAEQVIDTLLDVEAADLEAGIV